MVFGAVGRARTFALLAALLMGGMALRVNAQDANATATPPPDVHVSDQNASVVQTTTSAIGLEPQSPAGLSNSTAQPPLTAGPRDESAAPLEVSDAPLHYLLERVEVVGAERTGAARVESFVSIERGESFDVNDPEIEALRYHLLGTGWFEEVELRLKRGTRPGWAILVIEVRERSTLVFQQLAAGVGWSVEGQAKKKGSESLRGRDRIPEPYLGLGVAETNFLGTGRTIGGELLVSPDQQGIALRFLDPALKRTRWSLRAEGLFTSGREYFGGDKDVLASVSCADVDPEEQADCEVNPTAAVVKYYRFGLGLGTGRDVGSFTRLFVGAHGDIVNVPPAGIPEAASEVRGRGDSARRRTPIDFAIEPEKSYVSMLTLGISYDKRDSAVLPSQGTLLSFRGDLASALIGSDYEFVRLQASANRWFKLPWQHVIRMGGFAGSVFGGAPFFYKFFVSDLTDLQPSRILDLNLDHRPAPNLFGVMQCGDAFDPSCGTAIAQMRQEELAARVDIEYSWPFVRSGRGFIKGGDLFGLIGLYGLADPNDLRLAVPGYEGIARLPIDLTLDVGVRLDTHAGVFRVGFAKFAWLAVR